MYLSKIWIFLVTVIAAAAIGVALLMPRPADRASVAAQQQQLATACGVVDILLTDQARQQVSVTAVLATSQELVNVLASASSMENIDDAVNTSAKEIGKRLIESIDKRRPDFAMLIDKRGRIVARVNIDDKDFRDYASGRPLVDDALAGYYSDDIWTNKTGGLYLVRAAPVIRRDAPVDYVGAMVLGHAVNPALALQLSGALASPGVEMGFFSGKETVATSRIVATDNDALAKAATALTGGRGDDCASKAVSFRSGSADMTALVARLPGEAGQRGAYYAVIKERPSAVGFRGTFKAIDKPDILPPNFPWTALASAFAICLALGVGFIVLESDRPLKRLAADAIKLGKGESERLTENAHGGKYGSIARAINIHIDKVGREAKTARQDLDGLLGPAPEGGLGTIDLLSGALPAMRAGTAPAAAPPPSEFRFSDPAKMPESTAKTPPPTLPVRAAAKPPSAPTPPAASVKPTVSATASPAASMSLRLDDDILGDSQETVRSEPLDAGDIDPRFKLVFDQFVAMKKACNESIAGVTYGKFAEKLTKNKADLIAKTQCKDVRFTVYSKDGKAALKASPVRDEA